MNTYTTINDMREILWNTSTLRGNINTGKGEITGMGYQVYDVHMMKTDESQLMMS